MSEAAHLTYCGRELRRHDHDRYLTCLFAPEERRDAAFPRNEEGWTQQLENVRRHVDG